MPPFDGKAFGEEIVAAVKFHIDAVTKPLLERIEALESAHPERGEKGDDGPPGVDGLPGKDGRDGIDGLPGENGKDGIDGLPGVDGKDGTPGKDGVGLAGAVIDRSGNLVLTLTDGTTRDLGHIVGKDGEPGKPGADGLGWDDMTEELADDGRTIVRRYMRGDKVKEFRHTMAVVLDQGVYKDGRCYVQGDGVTYDGSFWIAQEQTADRPDTGKGWRLAVKRGRNGKDGVMKTESPKVPLQVG